MPVKRILKSIRHHTWGVLLRGIRASPHYPKLFLSYWHPQFHPATTTHGRESLYLGARPCQGAGIGHQMANWIAGYWWARQFGLKFAHSPFPSPKWEKFLGFGLGETTLEGLCAKQGYRSVTLPPFHDNRPQEIQLIERIIASYHDQKVVFLLKHNQPYKDQYGVMSDIQSKFYKAPARRDDTVVFSKDHFNIAVHVRRGDIVAGQKTGNLNHQMRWQDNDYFKNVLGNVLKVLKTDKPLAIYLFSQGVPEDFRDFEDFDNLRLCLDMNAQDSFLHMVFADLLITSKSSFSYKPALLSRGIRVCPKDFWHGYPTDKKWILADSAGSFGIDFIEVADLISTD
jgi:hypothetical protein